MERFAPKQVIAFAYETAIGTLPLPSDFEGGIDTSAFRVLKRCDLEVVRKAGARRSWIFQGNPKLFRIDEYLESLDAYTTYDMMSVSYEGTHLLRLEIDRSVKRVLALKHLPDTERKNFIKLTKARINYCEMQSAFGAGAIHASYAGGTGAGPEGMHYRQGLYRRALSDLLSVAEECKAYEKPAPPVGK